MILLVFLYAISASTVVIGKQLILYTTPLFLTSLRTLIAGSAFLIYAYLRNQHHEFKKYFFESLYLGIFFFYISNTFKFWSLQHIDSNRVAVISMVEPLLAAAFAYVVCGERMTKQRWLGLGLCLCGGFMAATITVHDFFVMTIPDVMIFCAIAASSYGAVYARNLIHATQASGSVIFGTSMVTAGMLALATAMCIEQPMSIISSENIAPFLGLLGLMVLVSNIGGYSLYGKLLNMHSIVLISSASLLRPFCVACFHGGLTLQLIVASCVILIGMCVLYEEELSKKSVVVRRI